MRRHRVRLFFPPDYQNLITNWYFLQKGSCALMKKFFRYLYFPVCFIMVLTMNVSAYLDPSVMTYTIQVVAGVLIAVGSVVAIFWRKTKKKVQNKLGIDENAKKEVEEDVVEFTDEKD